MSRVCIIGSGEIKKIRTKWNGLRDQIGSSHFPVFNPNHFNCPKRVSIPFGALGHEVLLLFILLSNYLIYNKIVDFITVLNIFFAIFHLIKNIK